MKQSSTHGIQHIVNGGCQKKRERKEEEKENIHEKERKTTSFGGLRGAQESKQVEIWVSVISRIDKSAT